jgi:glucan 1,3-beta-glucosidase
LIKKPIQLLVSTFLIGDPLNLPTLIAHGALQSNPVINGYDAYQGEGSSTKNFYMAVRNLKIDTTGIDAGQQIRVMDWSVSQGCSLTNVQIIMPENSEHVGITMLYAGSGIIISDSVSLLPCSDTASL